MLFGLALIPASFFVVIVVLLVVQLVVPWLRNVPHNPLQDLVRNRWDAVIFAFVVMIAGGVREEIQRGFVLRRFEQYLGGGAVGLVVFSALFGLGHLEQGRDVALATARPRRVLGRDLPPPPLDHRADGRPCGVQSRAGGEVSDDAGG